MNHDDCTVLYLKEPGVVDSFLQSLLDAYRHIGDVPELTLGIDIEWRSDKNLPQDIGLIQLCVKNDDVLTQSHNDFNQILLENVNSHRLKAPKNNNNKYTIILIKTSELSMYVRRKLYDILSRKYFKKVGHNVENDMTKVFFICICACVCVWVYVCVNMFIYIILYIL